MLKIRHALLALSSAVVLVATAGCSAPNTPGSDSRVTLNAGQLGSTKITEAMLEASGQSKDLDYEINWSLFESGPALMEAIPGGSVDVAMTSDTPVIFAQVADTPVKVVAAATEMAPGSGYVNLVVKPDSPIQNVADLVGKKVSLVPGSILQYSVGMILKDAGLDFSDIQVVNLNPIDAGSALDQGSIDVAALLDPPLANNVAKGARVIASSEGLVPAYRYTIASDSALADENKSAAIKDFIQRVDRAYEWAENNPAEWASIYAENTGLKPAVAETIVKRLKYTLVPIDEKLIADQQSQADFFLDLGLLSKKLNVADQFDTRFGPTEGK